LSSFPLPLGKGFWAPYFYCLVKITFSLQGQTKFRHIECVMLRKHSNRELFKQQLDSHPEPFIICFLAIFLMFFGPIYGLSVSKSDAMNLSFLFCSSILLHAAIGCHVNATFHGRICVMPRMCVPNYPMLHETQLSKIAGKSLAISGYLYPLECCSPMLSLPAFHLHPAPWAGCPRQTLCISAVL
jgi:hypothetical protein